MAPGQPSTNHHITLNSAHPTTLNTPPPLILSPHRLSHSFGKYVILIVSYLASLICRINIVERARNTWFGILLRSCR